MDNLKEKNRQLRFIFATVISIIINAFFWSYCLQNKSVSSEAFSSLNLFFFFISVILYCITFILFNIVFRKINFDFFNKSSKFSILAFLSTILIAGFFLYYVFINDTQIFASDSSNFIWHVIPFWMFAIIILLLYTAFLIFTNCFDHFSSDNGNKKEKMGFWLLSITIALLAGYSLYYPNSLPDTSDPYHFLAYYNSVYNIFYHIPYTYEATSVYGHYAILIVPFLRLAQYLGNQNLLESFACFMSVLTILTFLLQSYALSVFVKNKIIR